MAIGMQDYYSQLSALGGLGYQPSFPEQEALARQMAKMNDYANKIADAEAKAVQKKAQPKSNPVLLLLEV